MQRTGVSFGVAAVLCASSAFGHGRYPQSHRIVEHPRDPGRLYAASTFGVVSRPAATARWSTICDQAFAKEVADGDAMLEVLSDGSVLSGIGANLTRSSDCGCAWTVIAAAEATEFVADVAQDAAGGLVLLSYSNASGTYAYSVSESADAGSTWQKLADLPDLRFASAVEVAPSDPRRVYVSGYRADGSGVLAVSSDRGATWQLEVIEGAGVDNQPYVTAVHPSDAAQVFLRTSGITLEGAQRDTLLLSRDAGQSWSALIQQAGALFGFALSPDGANVAVGFGDRLDPALTADPTALGIYRASLTGEFSFEKVYSASVSCLTWTVTGLYACFAEAHPDLPHAFSIGLARDPAFTMDTVGPFEPLLKYSDALGPPACASAECGEHWTTDTCVSLQAQCDSVGSAADFGCSEAGIAGAGNGGAPVTDPTPARPNDDAEPAGCACTTARVPLNAGHAVAVGIAALAAAWRRRRHQRVSFCA